MRALLASRRLRTLAELQAAGVPTFAFVGPLRPRFASNPDLLHALFGQLVDAGVREVDAGVREVYMEHVQARTKDHRERLDARRSYANVRTDLIASPSSESWTASLMFSNG